MSIREFAGKIGSIAALTGLFLALSAPAFAQGFDWSRLLGGGGGGGSGYGGGGYGGGGGQRHQHQGQSNGGNGITVDRSSAPYTGKFTGKQQDQGIEDTMTAELACYPATDSDIPQARAFVCYAPGSNPNSSSGGGSSYGSSDGGGGGSYGASGRGGSYGPGSYGSNGSGYGPPSGGAPNEAPPGIE